MRTTVLPSMLEILSRNYNYRNKRAKLYEIGRIYLPGGEDGLATESKMLPSALTAKIWTFFTPQRRNRGAAERDSRRRCAL